MNTPFNRKKDPLDDMRLPKSQKYLWRFLKLRAFRTHEAPFWQKFFQRPRVFIPSIAFAVLMVLLFQPFFDFLPFLDRNVHPIILRTAYAQDNFKLEPVSADSTGVDSTTVFTLKSEEPIPVEDIASALQISEDVPFEVSEKAPGEYQIELQESLSPSEVVKFSLQAEYQDAETGALVPRDFTWGFQVKDAFKVISTLPADISRYVPLNSGIEIRFSHENFENFESFFDIFPAAKGRFEKHFRTLVFVPEGLDPSALYTVTIKKGLPLKDSEQTLAEDYRFQFETDEQKRQEVDLSLGSQMREFSLNEVPAFQVYYSTRFGGDDGSQEVRLPVTVYRYSDAEQFVSAVRQYYDLPSWAYQSRQHFLSGTNGLTQVFQADVPLMYVDYSWYFSLPEALSQGYYLLEISAGSSRVQTWMQITDLASYSTVSKTQSLVWVNDVSTSSPVKGATIEVLDSNERFFTDENGLAHFDTSDFLQTPEVARFLDIRSSDGKQLFVVLTNNRVSPASDYWSFLSLDRQMYLPNDTVRFWGFLQHRYGNFVKNIRVAVENPWYGSDAIQPSFMEKELEVEKGAFTGEFTMSNFLPGGYALKVYIGDVLVLDRWFEVQTYVKPAYKIDITSNKDAVFYGENIDFDILSSFFEGTPVPNMLLQSYWNGNFSDVTTDQLGQAQESLLLTDFDICKTPDDNKFCPFNANYTFSVSPKLSEEGQISESERIEVFFSHVELEAVTKLISDTQASVMTKAYFVDLDQYNKNPELGYRGGAALNQKIQGEVIREDWEKIQDGNFYDFISKKVVPKFRYESTEKVVDSFSGITNDRGEFSYNFPLAPDGNYRVKLWTYDDQSNLSLTAAWLWREQNYSDRFYSLQEQNFSEDDYDLGQDVILDFYHGNELLPQESSYLYFRSTNGIRDYELSDTPRYQFSFSERDIPSTLVRGVWFDGKHYFQGDSFGIRFRVDSRRLKVEVAPDKDGYKPGEKVQLSVKVSDLNGNPVSASVNLNLVDEAYYKLLYFSNPPDPLVELYYSFVDSGVLSQYGSHYYPGVEYDYGGKGGGGAGVVPRQNFEDTALFTVVTTGRDGMASTHFKLPDNLTSWRVTAQAVSTDLFAGFSSSYINVSLPLFVDTVNAKTYLTEDKPILSVRAFGKDLKQEDAVDFTVALQGGKEQNFLGQAFQASKFSLRDLFSRGELEEGDFKIQSTVKQGDKKDSMIEPFTVLTSRFTQPKLWTAVLRSGLELQGNSQGRTQLTVSDLGRGEVYAVLKNMAFEEGDRIDQLLARKVGAELLQQEFDEPVSIPELDLLRYQDQTGGIALLPYSDPELMLSADLAAFASGTFDVNRLKSYFYSIVDSSKSNSEEIVLALYGLASLDEPVLILLEKASETLKLDVVSRLYLALAFSELGDSASARNIFTDILASAEILDQDIFLSDKDRDQSILKTALLADLGAQVQAPEAHKLWNFVQKNAPQDFLLYPYELRYAVSRIANSSPHDVSFTLRVGDRTLNETLKNGEVFHLDLSSSELRAVEFTSFSGDILVMTFFEELRSDIKTDPRIALHRAYYVDGKPVTTFKEGDLVQVRLYPDIRAFSPQNFKALQDSMEVSVETILKPFIANEIFFVKDILPSGLMPVTNDLGFVRYDEQGCNLGGLSQVRDQSVTFSLSAYGFSSCGQNDFMYYYARVLNTGEYKVEPAMIFSVDNPSILNITESMRVIIE